MSAPHPAIRIAELLVFSAFVATSQLQFLLYMALPMIAVRCYCGAVALAGLALWRLKWFFIALGLISWFSSPGFPEDWYFAARTCVVIMLLVLAVDAFNRVCDTGEKLVALLWWLRPFRHLGVPVERFVARLWLTLQLIPEQQQLLQKALHSQDKMAGLRHLLQGHQENSNSIKPGTIIPLPHLHMSMWHWCRPLLLLWLLLQLRLYFA
ncbi:MAG: hypothetical protein ACNYPG_04140 [Candidatus Porifericomitaceae bacterium WSBS_2022_MAG_OTU9]